MYYYFLYNLLLLTVYFPISTANELYQDDKILLEYVQQPRSFDQFCENEGYEARGADKKYAYLKHQMEDHLGNMYLLRLEWKCDEIEEKFTDEIEKNGCKTYRNYLDIMYEYLWRMYAGMPAVKPKFYFDKTFAYSTLTETVGSLAVIWKFYFNSKFSERKGNKLKRLFIRYYKPNLLNEYELNYGTNLDNSKETFQDKIVQMGLEIKWDNGIKESYVKLIRLNFDEILWEMLKNWGKNYGYSNLLAPTASSKEISADHKGLLPNPFMVDPLEDITLIAYLKGPSHFEEICTELENEGVAYQRLGVKDKEELAQTYNTYLSLLYLMKRNWNCTKIVKQLKDEEFVQLECEKIGKYVDILYEYLFQIYAKTEMAELADLGPVISPLFQQRKSSIFVNLWLSFIINQLHKMSIIFFGVKKYADLLEFTESYHFYALYLSNADKLMDYQANFGNQNKSMREGFDAKLKTMLKEARKEEKMYKKDKRVSESPFYDEVTRTEDKVLIAFLKDESKFKQFCVDTYTLKGLLKGLINNPTDEQKNDFFTQKFEAHLGVVYLMRENWHCAKVSGEFEQNDRKKCQEYRKYLDILSKYLFTVGAEEDEDPVKAINSQLIIRKFEHFGTLTDVVRVLNRLSAFFFDPELRQKQNSKMENVLKNLKISMKNSAISIQKFEQIFESVTENEAIEAQMFKDETFDKKMEEMFKRAVENERKETEKLKSKKIKAEKKKSMEKEEMTEKSATHLADKFGTLLDSPEKSMEEEKMKSAIHLADKFGTLLDSPEKSMEEEKMKRAAFDDKFDTLLKSPFYPRASDN